MYNVAAHSESAIFTVRPGLSVLISRVNNVALKENSPIQYTFPYSEDQDLH